MEAINLCRLDRPIIFIEARINLSRFVVTGCAYITSDTVAFRSLNLISLFAVFFLHSIRLPLLMESYRSNLQHWFGPGGPYGFAEGSVPSLLLRTQGILYQITHGVTASSWLAQILFLSGAAAWFIAVWRGGD